MSCHIERCKEKMENRLNLLIDMIKIDTPGALSG